jgi:4'-phosphopantetheinyl transferase
MRFAMTEIWLIDLERSAPALAQIDGERSLLDAHDRRRALAVKDPDDRRQRLAAYTALRLLIERAAGPAARRPFVAAAGGKPRLAEGGVAFSLSHVAGYALIGLARGEIGVDLERERPLRLSARRRDELIAAAEALAGTRISAASADACLLQAWCRLEAFAKASGKGIGCVLSELGLRSGRSRTLPEVRAAARQVGESCLAVRDITLPPMPRGPTLYAAAALEKPRRLQCALLAHDRAGLERVMLHRPAGRR